MTISQEFRASLHTHSFEGVSNKEKNHLWMVSEIAPFDELLISWNALRPLKGHYVILSRVLIEGCWTSWQFYAVWGSEYQYSFDDATPGGCFVHSFQDQIQLLNEKVATGFGIRTEACNGASLKDFYHLYACTSRLTSPLPIFYPSSRSFPPLSVPCISQLCLSHPRSRSFCSPVSTTAVIQFLLSNRKIDPLKFTKQVYDAGFDIYGNWPFNTAAAFIHLGAEWHCFCSRLSDLDLLWQSLEVGCPIVISVKGNLPESFLPYSNGHLMVIKGYDAATQQFLCMDPAFPSDEQTDKTYPWEALMQAWGNRHYLAYFFMKKLL